MEYCQKRWEGGSGSAISDVAYGAPPPKRDFFLSRVYRDTADDDMRYYMC